MLTLLTSGNCQQSLVFLEAMGRMFVSPSKSIYDEILTPEGNDIKSRDLGRCLHPEGGTLMNGIIVL